MSKEKCDHCGARWGHGDRQFSFSKQELNMILFAMKRLDFPYGDDLEQEFYKKVKAIYEKSI